MKKLLLLASLFAISCQAQQTFTLKLSQPKDSKTTKYLIYLSDEKYVIPNLPNDSMLVSKGRCEYRNSTLASPRPAIVQLVEPDGSPASYYLKTFFIPGETLQINVKGEDYEMSGSEFYVQSEAFYDMTEPYTKKMMEISGSYRATMARTPQEQRDSVGKAIVDSYNRVQQDFSATMDSYLAAHAKEEGCAISGLLDYGDLMFVDKMDASVRNGRFKAYVDYTKASIEEMQTRREAEEKAAKEAEAKSAAGQKFIDFECEYDGKVQKLSDYVGKGQYVLVDFWASWCGPCKAEIPNLIKVYNAYKSDRFNVIGVATWDKPKDTLKAMEQLGIPYPQILNAQEAGSKAYGIQGIPQIILFGPDGTILKRDLRGDDIEKTVKEYLGK